MLDSGQTYFLTLTAVGAVSKCPLDKLSLPQLQLESLAGSGAEVQHIVNGYHFVSYHLVVAK